MLFRTAASFINNIKRTLCHPVSCGWLFLCPAVSICVLSFLLKWRMRQTSSQTSSLRSSCSNIHKKGGDRSAQTMIDLPATKSTGPADRPCGQSVCLPQHLFDGSPFFQHGQTGARMGIPGTDRIDDTA